MALTYEEYFRRYLVDPLTTNGNNPPTGGTGDGTSGGGNTVISEIVQGPPGPQGPQGIQGQAGPINTVENQGASLTTRPILNFTGIGVVASDDPVNGRTNIAIPGGGIGAVTSVFTRTGAVVAQSGDYTANQVTNAVSTIGSYADPLWIPSLSYSKLIGVPAIVNTFNGRSGTVVPTNGDYTAAQVTNAVSTTSIYTDPPWLTTLSYSKLINVPSMVNSFNTRVGTVVPASGDYTAAQVTNAVDSTQVYTNPTWLASLAWSRLTGIPTLVNSFNSRTGAVMPTTGDYVAAQITNAVDQTVSYTNPSWLVSIPYSKLTSVPSMVNTFNGRSGTVVPASGDYSASQVTNAVDSSGTYASPSWLTQINWSIVTGAPAFLTSLTPWTSNINGNNFNLSGVNQITTAGIVGVKQSSPKVALDASGGTTTAPATSGDQNTGTILCSAFYGGPGLNLGVFNGATNYAWIQAAFTNNAGVTIPIVLQQNGGNVGIGQSNPTHLLELSADSAAKPTTNTWTISSGAGVKQKVKNLKGGLEIIEKIRPIEAEYNGKGKTPKGQRVVSVIAEEIRKILPGTVSEDSEGNLGFNVHEVIFQLILAVQQLSAQVKELKSA